MSKKQGGAYARTRGHTFERAVANRLKEEGLYPEAKRHLENQAAEALGFDIDNTEPYYIQCKRNKQYAPITKLEEVQLNKLPDEAVPVLVTKGDRKKEVVCLYLDDFIDLLKAKKIVDEMRYIRNKDE